MSKENKKTILIAEDEKSLQFALDNKLESEDFNVINVKNGEEFIDVVKEGNIDLVLLDIKMPKMDGLEALKIIREGDQKDLPIIILSNLDDRESIATSMELGTYDYMVKADTNLSDLVDLIKTKLDIN